MAKLFPIIALILLTYIGTKYYKKLPKQQKRPFLIKVMVYVIVAALIIAVLTGKIHWLGAIVAIFIGAIKVGASTLFRFLPFLNVLRRANMFSNPVFRTPTVEVRVDLDSGEIRGTILSGKYEGKTLDELDESELNALEEATKENDKRAYYLIRVYRQRASNTQQNNDQAKESNHQYTGVSDPSIEEARLMLGLEGTYTKSDVDKSYKRLMQKLHPDRGGNDYLASRVNLARDLLTKHLNKKS